MSSPSSEIDTLEGVNTVSVNQMGLHTNPGCTSVGASLLSTSQQGSTDCSYLANNNSGCIVTDTNTASFGAGFAAAGGGIYVTEFATTGISIWFFQRSNIPASITSNNGSIDTSTFGTPSGNWPSTGCEMDNFFEAQNLIFDITLCGGEWSSPQIYQIQLAHPHRVVKDFAGNPTIFAETCSGVCYTDYVVGNGSNYATAYFEVSSVRVYSSNGTNNIISANGTSSIITTTSTASGSSPSGTASGAITIAQHSVLALLLSVAAGGVALLFS
ncbi:hypothetical protein C0991_005459 [Blastosporella zonata]|nr:hypothetical protein C0991_005459 [Blastosporella zonata]